MQQEPLDDPIASLPAPAIFAFLQNLSAKDLIACCLVSKQWRSYATVGVLGVGKSMHMINLQDVFIKSLFAFLCPPQDDRLWEEHCKASSLQMILCSWWPSSCCRA
jgi:hypothetical protein